MEPPPPGIYDPTTGYEYHHIYVLGFPGSYIPVRITFPTSRAVSDIRTCLLFYRRHTKRTEEKWRFSVEQSDHPTTPPPLYRILQLVVVRVSICRPAGAYLILGTGQTSFELDKQELFRLPESRK